MSKYDLKPNETIEHLYKRLAKAADQRLVRLEKLSKSKDYKSVLKYAYGRAMKDIKQWSGEKATRFNANMPKTENEIKAKIRDIRTFLESATSTKGGINRTYKKRADTINKKYGTNFTWQDLSNYFEQGKSDYADKQYGSETALKSIGIIQKNSDLIKEQIAKHKKKHISLDNPALEDIVNDILSDRKMNINQFL